MVRWGSRGGDLVNTALFCGAGLSLAVRVAVSLGRHDGPIGLAGLMLCMIGCARFIARKFDRSITATHALAREAERRRAELEEEMPIAVVRNLKRT